MSDTEGTVLDFSEVEEPKVPKARKAKSTNPKNIRKRIRRGTAKLEGELELLYADRKPIEDWDYEELARGRPRGKNGQFNGPAPKWITPAIRDEAKRRLVAKGLADLGTHLGDAIKVTAELMNDDSVDLDGKPLVPPTVRLQAAQFITDHVMGRATSKVELDLGDKTKQMLAGAIVLPDGQPAIVDGEVVDDDEEGDDEE